MRILWQSFTDSEANSPYVQTLLGFLNEIADEGTEFVFRGVSPPDFHLNRLTELRCAVQAISSIIDAEPEFDGFVYGHYQDAGLWEARAAIAKPMVGLGESSMLHACTMGVRIGLVTLNPTFIRFHDEQVRRYGLSDRVVAIQAIEADVALLMEAFEDARAYDELHRQFIEQAIPLIERYDLEVVIPAGGLLALLFGREGDFHIEGATVLNATALAAKQAETAVRLHRLNIGMPSRRGAFQRPSAEALAEFTDEIRLTPSSYATI